MYAAHGTHVYSLTSSDGVGTSVDWSDISNGLPGVWIYDLWIGIIGGRRRPQVLMRAAIPTRGIWEIDVTAGATDTALALYMRDNFLDMGRLPSSPDGVPNPYAPGDPGKTLYHYQCADIKVDSLQPGNASVAPFFQTDPEGCLPLSHVLFGELKENSDALPSGIALWCMSKSATED
jgi:hypothetical protein